MPDLRLIGVHEDGLHLILVGPAGEHHTVAIDDALRTAVRRDRPRMGQLQIDLDGGMRPREVQSLIRAGGSTEDVADRAGWSVDKVRRYEGPILAERVHVADQARMVRVRHRGGVPAGAAPTLQGRVAQRMRERGVDPDTNTSWDASRAPEMTTWTVTLTFAAGGRQRQAVWTYDPVLRSVEAVDDEARWLSADDVVVAGAGPLPTTPPRVASVYDVEAEGGVAATTRRPDAAARSGEHSGEPAEEPVDLMTAMRQRTTVGRRSGRRRAEPRGADTTPALPLDDAQPEVERAPAVSHHQHDQHDQHDQPELPGAVDPAGPERPADDEDSVPAVSAEPAEPATDAEPEELEETEPAGAEIPPLDEDVDPPAAPRGADDASTGVADGDRADVTDDMTDGDTDGGGSTEPEPEPEPAAGPATAPPRSSARRPRTSVPSWDDIMFGAKRD